MTEKEKMLSGKPYLAFGEELLNERQKAKEWLFDFTSLRPKEVEKRNEIIKKLFGKVSQSFCIVYRQNTPTSWNVKGNAQ